MRSKGLIITLIIVLSCFVLVLTGSLVFVLTKMDSFNFGFHFNDSNMELVDSYSVDFREVDKIDLNLNSTDLFFEKSDNDKVLIEYYSNQEKNPKVLYSNSIISINEDSFNNSCFGFCNINRKVVIYIPSEFINDIDIKTKSGDIKSDVSLSKVNFSTMSGDVFLNDVSSSIISTVSGDVSLGMVNTTNISTTSGDVKLQNILDNLDINTISGDVFVSNLDIKINSNIKTVSGDVFITNNESNCYVDFKTTSGDSRINKSDRKSDIVLEVRTTSGDISVD